jgi:hypothetical protein
MACRVTKSIELAPISRRFVLLRSVEMLICRRVQSNGFTVELLIT